MPAWSVAAVGGRKREYFHEPFPEFITSDPFLHINAFELLTIVVALRLWGASLKGQRIRINCDNQVSVRVMTTGRSRDPFLQACLREICFLAAIHELEIRAVHLAGVTNRLPDLLSRWDLSERVRAEFRNRTSHLVTSRCHVSKSMFKFSHTW